MDGWMGGGGGSKTARGEKIAKKEERGEDGRRWWKPALIFILTFNFSQLFPSFPSFFSAHKKILFFPARTKKQASKH
jgi:hypothetical protein